MKNYQSKMKKILSIATLIVFTFTSMASAQESVFKDLDATSPYAKDAIIALAEKNIIQGDNGYFNPAKTTNRAEMITMIVRALGIDTEDIPTEGSFSDVPVDHWAFKYVEAARREGIVEGITEDLFGKNLETTREQMAAMFVRALGASPEDISTMDFTYINRFKDQEQISAWARAEVEVALAEGLMMGVGENKFAPKGNAKREQVAVVVERFINSQGISQPVEPVEEVQSSALYNALVKNQAEYKGELHSNFNFAIKDLVNDETFTMTMEEITKVNGKDSHSVGKMIMEIDGEIMEDPMETITVNNKLYMKDFTEDKWFELDLDGLQEDMNLINEEFLSNFNSLNIVIAGEEDLEGTQVTKYVLKLSGDEANSLMPAEYADVYGFMMDTEEANDLEYIFEFYVNASEEIVKMVYSFNSLMEMEGESLEFNMVLVTNYKNIGVEYIITAPEDAELLIIEE